jgi:hypothetical protein
MIRQLHVNLIDEREVTSLGVLDSFSKDWLVNGTQ